MGAAYDAEALKDSRPRANQAPVANCDFARNIGAGIDDVKRSNPAVVTYCGVQIDEIEVTDGDVAGYYYALCKDISLPVMHKVRIYLQQWVHKVGAVECFVTQDEFSYRVPQVWVADADHRIGGVHETGDIFVLVEDVSERKRAT